MGERRLQLGDLDAIGSDVRLPQRRWRARAGQVASAQVGRIDVARFR